MALAADRAQPVLALALVGAGVRRRRRATTAAAAATTTAAQTEEFPAGTTMAKIQDKGEIVIGVKYDVPPFGFKNPRVRRDRGLRRRLRQGDRRGARRQAEARRGDLRQPHPVHQGRDGRPDPLDDDDQRRARDGDRVHRPVLRRPRPDPACKKGSRHHRRRRPRRQEGLHGAGLDIRGDAEEAGPEGGPQARRRLLRVPGADPERRRRRGLDRRRDPDRDDHPGRLARARAARSSRSSPTAAASRRTTRSSRSSSTTCSTSTSRTGAGRRPTTSGSASTRARSRSRPTATLAGGAGRERRVRTANAVIDVLSEQLRRVRVGAVGDARLVARQPRVAVVLGTLIAALRVRQSRGCARSAASTWRSSAACRCSCCCSSRSQACGAAGVAIDAVDRGHRRRSASTRPPTSPRRCAPG